MSTEEMFTRFYFFGTCLMGMPPDTFWGMPFGFFMDLWVCYKVWHGIEKQKVYASIDQLIPL